MEQGHDTSIESLLRCYKQIILHMDSHIYVSQTLVKSCRIGVGGIVLSDIE